VIIIDNLPENFRLQNNNGLAIKTWNEDMKDSQLSDFLKILTDIYVLKVPDVRNVIKRIREDLIKTKNNMNPYSSIDISKYL
jgi:TFIIF-interacting CTD phosphatase-like protein